MTPQGTHNDIGNVVGVEVDLHGVIDALEELGYLVIDPDDVSHGMVEQLASDLALRDDYNPNDVDPSEWPAITERYQAEALTLLEAVFGRNNGS